MTNDPAHSGVVEKLDQLNEFERQPVAADKLHGGGYFAAVFSGEHIAATEFVIGVLFVKLGARAFDVLVGLLIGNLLAVLSWRFVCAPIAVETRLTLYWYLRRIAGPFVTLLYNLLNGILFCILAGAMITVSASAVRIALGIPSQTSWYPSDARWVILVLVVGAAVVTLAILGFKRLAQFASICSPWMVLMFPAGALLILPALGEVDSFSGFWELANGKIWSAGESANRLGFWHVAAFAWGANLAVHLGLSDMALFRYARRSSYGWYSAFGMFLGHYLAWICAGIMGAATAVVLNKPLPELDAGDVGYQALGWMGALTVMLAGWTTANPTLYRAGLAFQVVTPGWPRWLVTLIAGGITTLVACFPWVFTSLLSFVAIYGIMLAPIGAIVVAEHWIVPRLGWTRYWSERKGETINLPALVSWGLGLALAAAAWIAKYAAGYELIHEFFLFIPIWIITTAVYLALAALAGARKPWPEVAEATLSTATGPDRQPLGSSEKQPGIVYYTVGAVAVIALVLCIALPIVAFMGGLSAELVKQQLPWLTLIYFAAALVWGEHRKRR